VRLAARTDDNQARIVNALRRAGCHVLSLAAVGNGCPDLLVFRGCGDGGKLFMLEVKDGAKAPSKRRLTRHQEIFHREWGSVIHVVKNEDEALRAVGLTE